MESNYSTPILFPVRLEIFWGQMRQLIREEIRMELKKTSPPADEPLLTRKEVAAFLKISLVTLHEWMKNLGLPFYRKRRGPRFLKSEILRWLKERKDKINTSCTSNCRFIVAVSNAFSFENNVPY